jgi:hypothetical protein
VKQIMVSLLWPSSGSMFFLKIYELALQDLLDSVPSQITNQSSMPVQS